MSTISASTTTNTGYVVTSDTTGTLVIQTGATPTTAMTVSSAQVVTLTNALPVASGGSGVTTSTGTGANVLGTSPTITTATLASPNITTALTLTGAAGTSGQALTSGGSGAAPTWTTIGASAATPTALGTVWASGDTGALGNQSLGYNAALNSDGVNAANQTAIGQGALQLNVTGTWNTAVGFKTLYNTTASLNVGVGGVALYNNTSGTYNTAVGHAAGFGLTSAGSNTLIGANTGASLTTGNVNTFIGRYAGQVFTTGSYNTHIGYATNASGAGQGSEIVISGGPNGATGKGGDTGFITPNGGPMFQGNNAGSWSTVSDRRLKKNIIDNNEGLNKLTQIQIRNFEYRTEEEITELPTSQVIKKAGIQFGVVAQELQAVLPDCVTEQSTGVLTIDSDNLTWYLINAVKELKAELDALKAKVA